MTSKKQDVRLIGKEWCWRVRGLLASLLLVSVQTQAQTQTDAWYWEAGLGGEAQWFDWREYNGAEQLLVESGPVFLLRGDAEWRYGQAFVAAELAIGGGQAEYDGQLQNGTPYQADAWEEIMESGLRAGVREDWGKVFLGFRQRNWDRRIDGSATVSSAHEVYVWRLLTAGGEYRFKRQGEWQAAVALEAGLPLSSKEKVDSNAFGEFYLEPGDGYYARLSLPLQNEALQIAPFVQWQSMEQSKSLLINGPFGTLYEVYQPESERIELGVQLRYRFAGSSSP